MNGTWGYKSFDDKWKSTETLIRNLIDIASKGGNYLLNIGPKADGEFPLESIERLKAIGKWMNVNSEAIYATQASPLEPLAWGRCTKKEAKGGTVLYFSVFDWPASGKLTIPEIKNQVISAKLLGNGVPLKTSSTPEGLFINLPDKAPDAIASVIRVELKGKIVNKTSSDQKKNMKSGELD
jgi:alpha-L-fucosidase